MSTHCPTCGRPITANDRCELRGALAYHVGCGPTSAGAPGSLWQALLACFGARS